MKKITISFGIESTVAIVTDKKGKVMKVIKKVKISNNKHYNENGILNYKEIVNELKQKIGKELKSLDAYIVMPDYLSDISYIDSIENDGKKEKELPDRRESSLKNKKVSYIGDSDNKSISQIIYLNEKARDEFQKELYKAGINVVNMISHYTALHNSIAAFNTHSEIGKNKTRIMIDLGIQRTGLIIFIKNLPVYINNSKNNLMNCYENLKEIYENLKFSEFIEVAQNISLDEVTKPEKIYVNDSVEAKLQRENEKFSQSAFSDDYYEDDNDEEVINTEEVENVLETDLTREIRHEVLEMLKELMNEVRETKDYASEKYNGSGIEIIASSNLVRRYINENLNLFNINSHKLAVSINTERNELDLTGIENLAIDMLLCIGSVVESLEKGADYYE